MNKKTQFTLIAFGVASAAYLFFGLIPEWKEQARQRDVQTAESHERNLQNQRESVAREELSRSLSKCAADSLDPRALREFITHELMPLGIAWQLYEQGTKSKPEAVKKKSSSSPEEYAAERLHEHFRSALHSELDAHQSEVQYKFLQWTRAKSEGYPTNLDPAIFNRYPPSFVFKTFNSSQFKNINPENIELGKKEISWPNFYALARRCKATPNDLKELSRDPATSQARLPGKDSAESVDQISAHGSFNRNSEYSRMTRQFWKEFSETTEYKKAFAEMQAQNTHIIREIIKVNEPLERRKQLELKAADDALFKNP